MFGDWHLDFLMFAKVGTEGVNICDLKSACFWAEQLAAKKHGPLFITIDLG